jgi:hypothetical protein
MERIVPLLKLYREWKWRSGYRATGYEKMRLASGTWPVPWDLILLRMKEGVELPAHRDVVRGKFATGPQMRVNVLLKAAKRGGEFFCEGQHRRILNRIFLFRADTNTHGVTKVEEGERIIAVLNYTRKARPGEEPVGIAVKGQATDL